MIKSKKIMTLFGVSALLLLVGALGGISSLPAVAEPLIIKFSPLGEDLNLLGGQGTFLGILGIMISILITNFLLAWHLFKKDRFLSYMLATATLITSSMFLLAVSAIISIN